MDFFANADHTINTISKGAFLTTKHADKTNTMTIGWGSIGYIWKMPIFMVMVRPSRFTHQLLESNNEFTVSIPSPALSSALGICGTKSGKDLDKIAAAGLTLQNGRQVSVPVIGNCLQHYECRVVFKQDMTDKELNSQIKTAFYSAGDYHTLYFAEIVTTYPGQ